MREPNAHDVAFELINAFNESGVKPKAKDGAFDIIGVPHDFGRSAIFRLDYGGKKFAVHVIDYDYLGSGRTLP